jgi:muramoyltetrapeptide carboxypeptidase
MLRARTLQPGATIAVVAPSAPCSGRSDVSRGVAWWARAGYQVKLGRTVLARDGPFAGSERERLADLAWAFGDETIGAVQCLHGGFGATHLVPDLPYALIAEHPKPFIGGSDITVLHTAIRQRTGLVSFYGPGLTQIAGATVPDFNRRSLLGALTACAPLGEVPADPEDGYRHTLVGGSATGTLVGGALWVTAMTVGTPWQIDLDGAIWLLEEINEAPWRMDALLTHLRQAGVLNGVAGVAIAKLVDCDWSRETADGPFEPTLEDVLQRHFEQLGVPCVWGFPLGHGRHKATAPLGVRATLDADAKRLTIEEPALV